MKESIRSIQQDGYSKPLLEVVKQLISRKSCIEIIQHSEHSYCSISSHYGLSAYHEGLVEESSSVLSELCLNGVIEVDITSHKLLRVNGKDVNGVEHNQVLDLSDDGERWEGDVLNNQPCGWGVLYDNEGEKAYEGFRIGEVNVCYGRSYYSDIQKVEYEGEWFEGKRWGRGVQYDRNGKTMFDGEWMNDKPLEKRVEIMRANQLLHNRIEELIVSNGCCNGREWSAFDLSVLMCLRELTVGDHCFQSVNEVRITDLHRLERVVIGKKCYVLENASLSTSDSSYCRFYLKNCEKLKELKIGRYSFCDYTVCKIENLPSLEVIEVGDLNEASWNFKCGSLLIKGDCQRMT